MVVFPDMMIQYVHWLNDELIRRGVEHPVIKLKAYKSLNGRLLFPIIDPNVNLANKNLRPFMCPDWILPHPDLQKTQLSD